MVGAFYTPKSQCDDWQRRTDLKRKKSRRKKWIMMSRNEFEQIYKEVQNEKINEVLAEHLDDELKYLDKRKREIFFQCNGISIK